MVEEEKKKIQKKEEDDVTLVRVLGKDIRGDRKLGSALTQISGISWTLGNAICKVLKLDRNQRVQDVGKDDMAKIEEFIKDPKVPAFLKNRQKDLESGEDQHVSGADLKLRKEFDIKRLKKIRCYKGARHAVNLPVRGQRTKGNFRRNRGKSVAATKKKVKA
jgi:small subunit ribosomal protein S13